MCQRCSTQQQPLLLRNQKLLPRSSQQDPSTRSNAREPKWCWKGWVQLSCRSFWGLTVQVKHRYVDLFFYKSSQFSLGVHFFANTQQLICVICDEGVLALPIFLYFMLSWQSDRQIFEIKVIIQIFNFTIIWPLQTPFQVLWMKHNFSMHNMQLDFIIDWWKFLGATKNIHGVLYKQKQLGY